MDFQRHTILNYYGAAFFWIATILLIGIPVRWLFCKLSPVARSVNPSFYGIGSVCLLGWYWAGPFDAIRVPIRVLTILGACLTIAILAGRIRGGSWRGLVDEVTDQAGPVIFCVIAMIGLSFLNEAKILTFSNPTVVSLGNNDAPGYALSAQHLLDHGPNVPGNIVGFDMGVGTVDFGFGSYATLAHAAAVTNQPVWKVMQPTLFALTVLGAVALANLLERLVGKRWRIACYGASVLAMGAFYPRYLLGQWFFAQFLGLLAMLSILTALHAYVRIGPRTGRLRAIPVIGFLVLGGLLIYPPMAVLGSAVLAPAISVEGTGWRRSATNVLRSAAALLGGLLVAACVAPGAVRLAYRVARNLAGVSAGWRLPVLWPIDLLGLRSNPLSDTSVAAALLSLVALAILIGIALYRDQRADSKQLTALVCLISFPLLTYVLVNVHEDGTTYQLFKWVAFFLVPLLGALFLLSYILIASVAGRSEKLAGITQATLVIALGIIVVFPATVTFRQMDQAHEAVVTRDQALLTDSPALSDIQELQISVTPYWDGMWVAYFLRDKTLYLTSPTYYPTSNAPDRPVWQLELTTTPVEPGAQVVPVNATYQLRLITS